MTAHSYVLYTTSGNEQEMINLLEHTAILTDDEFLYHPVVEYTMKIARKERLVQKALYPGYIFLNTRTPVGFIKRLTEMRFFKMHGNVLRPVRGAGDPAEGSCVSEGGGGDNPDNGNRDSSENGNRDSSENGNRDSSDNGSRDNADSASRDNPDSGNRDNPGNGSRDNPGNGNSGDKYQTYIARISDEEEKTVFALCGIERTSDGSIVRKRQGNPRISPEDLAELVKAGVDMGQFFHEEERPGQDTPLDIPFTVGTSHGVKLVRKGSHPGQRRDGDVRTIILDGPLAGMEGQIVRVDIHRRRATVRTTFMHRTADIEVPLTIVKTVEE